MLHGRETASTYHVVLDQKSNGLAYTRRHNIRSEAQEYRAIRFAFDELVIFVIVNVVLQHRGLTAVQLWNTHPFKFD